MAASASVTGGQSTGFSMTLQTSAMNDNITVGPAGEGWTLSCNGSTCVGSGPWTPMLDLKNRDGKPHSFTLTANVVTGANPTPPGDPAVCSYQEPAVSWSVDHGLAGSWSTTSNITLTNGGGF